MVTTHRAYNKGKTGRFQLASSLSTFGVQDSRLKIGATYFPFISRLTSSTTCRGSVLLPYSFWPSLARAPRRHRSPQAKGISWWRALLATPAQVTSSRRTSSRPAVRRAVALGTMARAARRTTFRGMTNHERSPAPRKAQGSSRSCNNQPGTRVWKNRIPRIR